MLRTALPQNFVLNDGTLFEGFETPAEWTPKNCTHTADTVHFKAGTKSIKITTTAGQTNVYIEKIISQNLSTMKNISLWYYVEDASQLSGIYIRLSSTANFSKYFEFRKFYPNNGWNLLRRAKEEAYNTGGESWNNTMIRLRVQLAVDAGKTPVVSVDDMRINFDGIPKVILSFDGSGSSLYNIAFPIMEPLGIKGTNYIQSNDLLSIGLMDALYAAGWDQCNHTHTHPHMTTLTYQQQYDEIKLCDDILASRGYSFDRRRHFAPPFNEYDTNTQAALNALGYLTLRTGHSGSVPYPPQSDFLSLEIKEIQNTTPMNTVYAAIDNAFNSKSTLIIFTHGVKNESPSQYEMLTSDFVAMLNYIRAKGIQFVTMSEWYNQLTHPRKVVSRT